MLCKCVTEGVAVVYIVEHITLSEYNLLLTVQTKSFDSEPASYVANTLYKLANTN